MGARWRIVLCCFALQICACSSSTTRTTVHMLEETNEGTVVTKIERLKNAKTAIGVTPKYKILSQNVVTDGKIDGMTSRKHVTNTNWLKIDAKTGIVRMARFMDRDLICSGSGACVINAQIVILPQPIFQLVELHVVIDDKNDNTPSFPVQILTLNISESWSVGEIINLDAYQAKDKDSGNNSLIHYTLSKNQYFGLKQYIGDNNSPHLQLFLMNYLDHEETSEVELTIEAKDSGIPVLSSRMYVKVEILDANDNYPIFQQEEYVVNIEENTPQSSVIATVKANDPDSGLYGKVRYSLPARNSELVRKLINIDERKGTVMLKEPIDREIHNGIRVLILARDSDPTNQKTGETWLLINVEDVNDNSPEIRVDFILNHEEDKVYISESAPAGTYIGRLSGLDADEGMNGKVHIQVTTTALNTRKMNRDSQFKDKNMEQFGLTSDGFLESKYKFDRELCDQYNIIIKACDNGSPPRCATKVVIVIILDENEFTPKITTPIQHITLREDAYVGTEVTTITAKDGDNVNGQSLSRNETDFIVRSLNGDILYSITDGNDGTFSIGSKSGLIRLVSPLDREQKAEWKLTVTATDGGSPPLQSSCDVIIQVDDVNDNAPRFISPSINNSLVLANVLRDDIITTIQAKDKDSGFNGKVTYFLEYDNGVRIGSTQNIRSLTKFTNSSNSSDNSTYFTLNPITGDLRINFSRPNVTASIGLHKLVIKAQDSGTPPIVNRIILRIDVAEFPIGKGNVVAGEQSNLTSSTDLLILAISLGCATIFLMILIIAVAIKCKRMNKEYRTYSVTMHSKKRPESMDQSQIRDDVSIVDENDGAENNPSGANDDAKSEEAGTPTKKQEEHFSLPNPLLPSDNVVMRLEIGVSSTTSDGDSGRGDSEIDSASFNTHENKEIQQKKELGPHCDEKCLKYGHSDACWMPINAESNPDTQARKQCALTHYDWNKLKPRYYNQERNRHSLAPPSSGTNHLNVPVFHPFMRRISDTRLPTDDEKLSLQSHFNHYMANKGTYSADIPCPGKMRKALYQPCPVARSCQSTPIDFNSRLQPLHPNSRDSVVVECGSNVSQRNLDTVYEMERSHRNKGDLRPPLRRVVSSGNAPTVANLKAVRFVPCSVASSSTQYLSEEKEGQKYSSEIQLKQALNLSPSDETRFSNSDTRFSMQETRKIIDDIESLLV